MNNSVENLAMLVHAAWRDGMKSQGRDVPHDRLTWEFLPEIDKQLDRMIAQRILDRLLDSLF